MSLRAPWPVWAFVACTMSCSSPDKDATLFDDDPTQGQQASGPASTGASSDGRSSVGTSAGTSSGGAAAGATLDTDSGSSGSASIGAAGSRASPGPRRDNYEVPGGSFAMGRSVDGSDACPDDLVCLPQELPEHNVTVESFALDATEVTVAEFRQFVSEFIAAPPLGAGAHPHDPESGWHAEYDAALPSDAAELGAGLDCDASATYTDQPGANDDLPVNCVTWYEAMAFCISRGGRLPSEAEWEFAAAGGSENRLYPWGSEAATETRAAVYPSGLVAVGSLPDGYGRWHHADLAGNVWEWVLDWLDPTAYEGVADGCVACVSSAQGIHRGLRGGAYSFDPGAARAAARSGELPSERKRSVGFRCAYDD